MKMGLKPTPKEKQKYSFGAIYGYPDIATLPDKYDVGEPLEIKDQKETMACVAYSLTAVSEYQEGVPLEPTYTVKLISEIEGEGWVNNGTSLDVGAKAALNGFLPRSDSPYTLEKFGISWVANPLNWNSELDEKAKKHAKKAWFWIGSSNKLKMFDAIRSAMWKFKDEKRAVQTGVIWNDIWSDQTKINKEGRSIGGHAIAIKGWDGDYLKIQNSYGKSVGENGIQYIHKNLVNKLFRFGALMFLDLPETHEAILEKSEWYRASWFKKLFLIIKSWIK